jgi:hypothetical protein
MHDLPFGWRIDRSEPQEKTQPQMNPDLRLANSGAAVLVKSSARAYWRGRVAVDRQRKQQARLDSD